MVISGYLDHQSTQFRLSASELLLFVSVVLVLINALYGIPNCDDLVSLQLIYYDKKKKKKKKKKGKKRREKKERPFPYIILLFGQFNMLHLSVSLYVKCVLFIGHCGRRNIKVPSVKNPELTNVFP